MPYQSRMTVAELIEKLKSYPQDAVVVMDASSSTTFCRVTDVELIEEDTVALTD